MHDVLLVCLVGLQYCVCNIMPVIVTMQTSFIAAFDFCLSCQLSRITPGLCGLMMYYLA